MNATVIQDVIQKRPFQPFLIQYDGSPVRVEHPEQALFNASHTVLIIVARDDHISGITLTPRRGKTGH